MHGKHVVGDDILIASSGGPITVFRLLGNTVGLSSRCLQGPGTRGDIDLESIYAKDLKIDAGVARLCIHFALQAASMSFSASVVLQQS